MANINKGEVALKVGDKEYVLHFSANALCDLEDVLGKPIMQLINDLRDPQRISMKNIRAMLWAGLKDHHPKITLNEAGNIVEELSMMGAYAQMARAFEAAFPSGDDNNENPQEPDSQEPAGIGLASSKAG